METAAEMITMAARSEEPGGHALGREYRFRLAGGRTLGCLALGEPAGSPVLYFHGYPGSRIEGRLAAGATRRLGTVRARAGSFRFRRLHLPAGPDHRRLGCGRGGARGSAHAGAVRRRRGRMSDLLTVLPRTPKRIGVAADHGGYDLREHLARMLREAGYEVIDFGDRKPTLDDDYPDFVVPLAHAVARGEVERGVAVCGSGVGASVVANKVVGVRACLIHETFSAHQGVEDDDLNMICLGGLVVGRALAWELVRTVLAARFSGAERHRRRLAKVAELERTETR